MSCCSIASVCPSLECAPCPPFFVVDIYQILVNVSLSLNLTEDEYKAIAKRCNIQEPTTTTSTTTTTTTKSTTTTTISSRKTTIDNIRTSEKADTTTSKSHSQTSNITDSGRTTVPIPNSTMWTTPSKSELNLTSTRGSTPPRTTQTATGNSRRQQRWPYCNDVCLIIVITSSVCVFLVVLVLLSLCCRRKRTHDKTGGRRTSSQRLVANGTYDRTASFDRIGSVSEGVWRHNPGIENLAYRKSMELREPLKYMEYEQNWEDLDYYGTGSNKNIKDGSLRSDKTSQRSDNSPRRKRRPNKDKKRNSMEGLNGRPGMVFIPLDERKPRSLPRIPVQSYSDKQEFEFPNGIRSSSLPRTSSKHQYPIEHRRSKSDGNNKPRSKQRPRSFDQLYYPPRNIDKEDKAVNGAMKRNQKSNLNSEPYQIKNTFPTKDDNLKRAQDRKTSNTSYKTNKPKTENANQKPTIMNHRGLNRSLERINRTNDNIFPTLDGSSSPKFYPPYRDSNNQNVLFTTKL